MNYMATGGSNQKKEPRIATVRNSILNLLEGVLFLHSNGFRCHPHAALPSVLLLVEGGGQKEMDCGGAECWAPK